MLTGLPQPAAQQGQLHYHTVHGTIAPVTAPMAPIIAQQPAQPVVLGGQQMPISVGAPVQFTPMVMGGQPGFAGGGGGGFPPGGGGFPGGPPGFPGGGGGGGFPPGGNPPYYEPATGVGRAPGEIMLEQIQFARQRKWPSRHARPSPASP